MYEKNKNNLSIVYGNTVIINPCVCTESYLKTRAAHKSETSGTQHKTKSADLTYAGYAGHAMSVASSYYSDPLTVLPTNSVRFAFH